MAPFFPNGQVVVFPKFCGLTNPWGFSSPFQGLVQRLWDALLPRPCQVQVALFGFLKKGKGVI